MITYIKKDLTTVTKGVIVQGTNCFGVMGSGLALALRTKWPQIFEPYKQKCDQFVDNRQQLLGNIVPVLINENLIVVNAFTQLNYGRGGKVYADVDAIRTSLKFCAAIAKGANLPLCLPPIGCGLGGLDFVKDVKPIIEFVSERYNSIDIFVCDL